ncbi:SRPBCC family protein [Lysobacter sp. CA199]|uniref:SRPBCC family protein n=1 Tax=Lysobacter sp. CA199 TaxID=3455608 RepID=UPI003F8D81CB
MLTIVLAVLAALIALFVVVVAMQPAQFRVARSILIDAPAAAAFAQVQDLRRWPAWSPFEKIDPNLQRRYDGAADGEGAIYDWVGDKNAGEGRATIVQTRQDARVAVRLDFRKPFQASNLAEFDFKPRGDQTEVTWAMSGRRNFMFKAMGLFMSMDKMVGGMFEQGLKELKTLSETNARA